HTAESRAHFRHENPALADVRDEDLTHYIENVTLPSDALQLYWVTGCLQDGEDALGGLNIHVPQQVLVALAETAPARGLGQVRTAKMRHYGIGAQQQNVNDLYPNVASFVTPFDAALALLFQQPDLMNINVTQGASILQLLQTLPCTDQNPCDDPYINTLAFRIASAWPATESGMVKVGDRDVVAWAKLVPVIGEDGQPVLDDTGKRAWSYSISDETGQALASASQNLRKAILNSTEFEGFNWHPTRGRTTDEQDVGQANSRSRVSVSGLQGGTQQVQVVGEHGQGTTVHGVQFSRIAVVDQAKRTVQVDVRNHFVRFVSAFVRFASEAGDLPFTPAAGDTERSRFLRLLNSNFTVFGVPLLGNDVEQQTLQFDIPADATKARLIFGSLGVGGEAFSPEAVSASVFTLAFNIGIPTIMLATGTAGLAAVQRSIISKLRTIPLTEVTSLVVRVITLAGPQVATGIFGTSNSGNAKPVLISLANAVVSAFASAGVLSSLLINLGAVAVASKIPYFFGPLGLAFTSLAVAADVATLAQTVAEVLASPAVFTNTLSLRMSTRVRIFKDPDNATFPARARRYEVILTYDQASKLAHKMTGAIEAGREAPIEVTFDSVPSGGKVSIEVILRSDDDWIAGGSSPGTGPNRQLGPIGPIDNNPATAGAIDITIKEQLVPLTQRTRYNHLRKLAYQAAARVW
ncbi:MAG TPA: hypothetical protein VKD72_20530, partial [Gemmataceae bacterium]|nr:hypothetical protein [Gemmataceae bacterium]